MISKINNIFTRMRYLLLLLMAAGMWACAKDKLQIPDDKWPVPEGYVRVELRAIVAQESQVATRASEDDENYYNPNQVYVLSFDSEDKLTQSPVLGTVRDNKIYVLLRSTAEYRKFYIVANLPESMRTAFNALNEGESFQNVATALTTQDVTAAGVSNPFPMCSDAYECTGGTVSITAAVSFNLNRIVARIDVVSSAVAADFVIESATLANGAKQGTILPMIPIPNRGGNVNYDESTTIADNSIRAQIYCYENAGLSGGIANPTKLIVKGKYKGGNSGYYRLDIVYNNPDDSNDPTKYYDIKRNYRYTVVVKKVENYGYLTYQEALANTASNNIVHDVIVTDPNSHDIVSNGEYYLGVSNSEVIIFDQFDTKDFVAFTLSSNAPVGTTCQISASGNGITVTPTTTTLPATAQEITIALTDEFSSGEVVVRVGNLVKKVTVTKRLWLPFPATINRTFGSNEYVRGVVASGYDWLHLSDNDEDMEGTAEVTSNQGGIYMKSSLNMQKKDGLPRNAEVYLWRRGSEGRIKAFVSQDILNTDNIKDDESALPTNFFPVVGAFWRAEQTGERLIRMIRPFGSQEEQTAIDGEWFAMVIEDDGNWNMENGDGIIMDTRMTEDPKVGWREGNVNNYNLTPALGNDVGFDNAYKVTDPQPAQGTVSASTGGIYFRIGLQKPYSPTADKPARYAVVIVIYTYKGEYKVQRIFIRQGHAPDYIMKPGDPNSQGGSVAAGRSLAKKFSVYNMTDPNKNANFNLGSRSEGNGRVALNGAVEVNYPSQAGYFFSYHNRDVFSPLVYAQGQSGEQTFSGSYSFNRAWTRDITGSIDQDEVCPPGYRTPKDGTTYQLPDIYGRVINSELRQSLFVNPVDGDRPVEATPSINSVENQVGRGVGTIVGIYADGFMDRYQLRQPKQAGNYAVRAYSAAALGSVDAAYQGRLFYNPVTYASIFFPYAGSFAPGWTGLNPPQPYYMGEHAVYGTSTRNHGSYEPGFQMLYVGYAKDMLYIPDLVVIANWEMFAATNIRCVKD